MENNRVRILAVLFKQNNKIPILFTLPFLIIRGWMPNEIETLDVSHIDDLLHNYVGTGYQKLINRISDGSFYSAEEVFQKEKEMFKTEEDIQFRRTMAKLMF